MRNKKDKGLVQKRMQMIPIFDLSKNFGASLKDLVPFGYGFWYFCSQSFGKSEVGQSVMRQYGRHTPYTPLGSLHLYKDNTLYSMSFNDYHVFFFKDSKQKRTNSGYQPAWYLLLSGTTYLVTITSDPNLGLLPSGLTTNFFL